MKKYIASVYINQSYVLHILRKHHHTELYRMCWFYWAFNLYDDS